MNTQGGGGGSVTTEAQLIYDFLTAGHPQQQAQSAPSQPKVDFGDIADVIEGWLKKQFG